MNLPEKVTRRLRELPDKPGCYMMRDRRGRIIYVGKAVSLRKRVQWYFRNATRRGADPKLRGLIKSIHDLDYIVVRNEAEALLTEGRLIKDYKPYYNVTFKDDKRFLLLRADVNSPLPRFTIHRIRREDGAFYFGPYASSPAARATLDFIERKYGLRKCSPRVPDPETYRHCMNDIIRFCSAPCVGKVSAEEYRERFEEACAFLRGERPDVIKELADRMEQAAAEMKFEKAAVLRDTLLRLRSIVKQRARVAPTPEIRAQEAMKGVDELRNHLGLKRLPLVIEGYDISNISGTYAVASMVCSVEGMPKRNRYRRFRIKAVSGADDPGMMAEVVSRRFCRLKEEEKPPPDLVIVDGGKPQLRAARRILDNLGFAEVPCAGLAKRFEEIYWKDGGPPIRLPKDSAALKVLRQLRDEAHRFALSYHRRLRNRKIKESVLDDVPGVGSKRKQLLLETFGSVSRLRKATEEEILEIPGIGVEMARTIRAAVQ